MTFANVFFEETQFQKTEDLLEFWHPIHLSVEVNKNFIKILGNTLDKWM